MVSKHVMLKYMAVAYMPWLSLAQIYGFQSEAAEIMPSSIFWQHGGRTRKKTAALEA
jgi:hypothetical protein